MDFFTEHFPIFNANGAYSVGTLVLVTTVFILAGAVKGVVGLGLPTISMALLALLMSPAQAAALLVIPSLLTNIWQMRPFDAVPPLLRSIGTMQIGIFAGTMMGAWLLGAPAGDAAGVALGVALVAYACWGLTGRSIVVSPAARTWMGPLVGFATGFITAATGVFVVPAVPYLQALQLSRDRLIQAMGVSFSVSTIALALGLWLNHSYAPGAAGVSLLMLIPALMGMSLGQSLRQRLPVAHFKKVFFCSLIVLGLYQVAAAV
ncbi:MAG: sulfite exporter TauE/SafE family protein [Advenella sp.]|uniref:sulfite exporter TauE/SafE family protein n=1 Tax=Advenella sp. TaxID=1872388 RepID=UPI003F9B2064